MYMYMYFCTFGLSLVVLLSQPNPALLVSGVEGGLALCFVALGEAGVIVIKWLMSLISSDVTEPQHHGSPCVHTSNADGLAGSEGISRPVYMVHIQKCCHYSHIDRAKSVLVHIHMRIVLK